MADHPRSRGVYRRSPRTRRGGGGSSPLARGLQEQLNSLEDVSRIIPARAGFTSSAGADMVMPSDHPRSRGVYPSGHVRYLRP